MVTHSGASSQACRCPLQCSQIHKQGSCNQRRLRIAGLPSDFPPAQFGLETGPSISITGAAGAMPPVPEVRQLQRGRLRPIGTVLLGSHARVVLCSRCTPLAQAGGPQPPIRTPGASGPCDGCRGILPPPADGGLFPLFRHRSFVWNPNPRKTPTGPRCLRHCCFFFFQIPAASLHRHHLPSTAHPSAAVGGGRSATLSTSVAPLVPIALPRCLGSPLTGSLDRPRLRIRGVALRPPPPPTSRHCHQHWRSLRTPRTSRILRIRCAPNPLMSTCRSST
jgi:hypothetical protein